ncbi:Uncharacterised protein [[Clostridium] symbiosum]|uniref:hypothetical protein n=1 Tax=Clostridium symbiosum TaxID=1512 RepID=UPI0006C14EB1|nr:hypothetical protein [[Clostridium] symbiosum]CUP35356.1 Uncharacterised protein [[Clostridium] symbiosum]
MNGIVAIGIVILCIALFFKTKPKESIEEKDNNIQDTEEIIQITEFIQESEIESIKKELHEINNTLSFFKSIVQIIIIFIIIKYIILATVITQAGNVFSKFFD